MKKGDKKDEKKSSVVFPAKAGSSPCLFFALKLPLSCFSDRLPLLKRACGVRESGAANVNKPLPGRKYHEEVTGRAYRRRICSDFGFGSRRGREERREEDGQEDGQEGRQKEEKGRQGQEKITTNN